MKIKESDLNSVKFFQYHSMAEASRLVVGSSRKIIFTSEKKARPSLRRMLHAG